jgi:hypothetical protein
MAELSNQTKALKAAWEQIRQAGRPESPEPPWSMNQKDKTSEEAINRLIKQAPAGSAKRQELMALKVNYFEKEKDWKIELDKYNNDYEAALDAWKASEKLDKLSKKQQDNKDTSQTDEKLDAEIKVLEEKVSLGSKEQTPATSAAALGLPASSLTRESTVAEKAAKIAADEKGQVPPKVPDAPKVPDVPELTNAEQRQQALEMAGEDFELPETIFKNVPSLNKILGRYVKENWTESKLRKAIRENVWFRKNSAVIKQRYVQLYNYQDLVDTGQIDPQVPGNTQYEQDIAKLERQIADKARTMGSALVSDPDNIKSIAQKMYLTNQGIDDPMTTDFIAAAIRPITSTIGGVATQTYSGQALKDYQAIQDIARSNGLRVKDIIPGGFNERQVLEGIATGRLDPNRIAQDTRILAQQGQPQYVRDLLSQGYNLDQVFAPYRQTMANLLEINADEIDLNDSTLRSAISDKGDMNVYDFKKTLKQDNRWQYTENAKQEVADATLKILRDFGLQG